MNGTFINIKICAKCKHVKIFPWNDEQRHSASKMFICNLNGICLYLGWGYPEAAKPELHSGRYVNVPEECPYVLEHTVSE